MRKILALVFFLTLFSSSSFAGISKNVQMEIEKYFPAANKSKALTTALYDLDPSTLNGYVVLEKGGIAAERARYFIDWGDYEYRGVVVNLAKDGEVTTRRGKVYTFLQRGDVLAVVETIFFSDKVYLKLITPDVYVPENRKNDEHHSRVTVMLGFKLPKEIIKGDDPQKIIDMISAWVRPFKDAGTAQSYAAGMREEKNYLETAAVKEEEQAEVKPKKKREKLTSEVEKERKIAEEKDRIDALEKKIEDARREMEEAEKEINKMKEEKVKK